MRRIAVLLLSQVVAQLSVHANQDGVQVDLMPKKLLNPKSDDFQCKSTIVLATKSKVLSVEKSKDIVLPLRVRLSPNLIKNPHAFLKFKIGDTFPRRTITIGLEKGLWMTEEQTESFGDDSDDFDERTLYVNRQISLFGPQVSGKDKFTSLYIRCHSSSMKEHDYSYFIVSTPGNEDDAPINVKLTPAPEDCLGHVAIRVVDKNTNKSFVQLGYECNQPLHTLCSHDQECMDPGTVCMLVPQTERAECQCSHRHAEIQGEGCVKNEKRVGASCTSSYQCEAAKAKCRTTQDGTDKVCRCQEGSTLNKGVCEDPFDRPRKQMDLATLGHPWMPWKSNGITSVAGLAAYGCQTLLPGKKLEQLPIHWNMQGAVINMWVRSPGLQNNKDTSELTVHFLHTDAQHDDVIPVFKVKISFGDVAANKSVQVTRSANLRNNPVGKVEMAPTSLTSLSREDFSPVKLVLNCDSTLSCGFSLDQGQDQVFRQSIGQFDPMFQPNVFTLSAPEGSDMVVRLGCRLGHGEECMDDVECTGSHKCWSSQQLWEMGGLLLGKLINGVNSVKQQQGQRTIRTCVCQTGLKWDGRSCQ